MLVKLGQLWQAATILTRVTSGMTQTCFARAGARLHGAQHGASSRLFDPLPFLSLPQAGPSNPADATGMCAIFGAIPPYCTCRVAHAYVPPRKPTRSVRTVHARTSLNRTRTYWKAYALRCNFSSSPLPSPPRVSSSKPVCRTQVRRRPQLFHRSVGGTVHSQLQL